MIATKMVKLLQQLLLANLGEIFLLTTELFQKIWAIFHSNNLWHYIPPSTSVLRAKTRLTETPPALFTGFPLPNGLDGMAFVNLECFAPDLVIEEGSSVTSDFILFLTVSLFGLWISSRVGQRWVRPFRGWLKGVRGGGGLRLHQLGLRDL